MTLFSIYVPGFGFGMSFLSIVIFVGSMILAGLASWRVRSRFKKYSEVAMSNGMTGAEVAKRILAANGLHHVPVHPTPGALTDHYDPTTRSVHLSEPVYYSTSVSAAGVAAHEVGHALQHQASYAPLHARSLLIKTQPFISPILMFVPFLGMFAGLIPGGWKTAMILMCIAMGVLMIINLVTLPVEFDASHRAKKALASLGLVQQSEADGVSKVLWAAALTYVAAFLTSLAQFLYYVLPLILGNRRSEE